VAFLLEAIEHRIKRIVQIRTGLEADDVGGYNLKGLKTVEHNRPD
jgi:hypothetical protein